MIRKIIQIDEEKCNGCGACAEACHEGAIGMVNGKAKLLRDDYCDGLGDCLPVPPEPLPLWSVKLRPMMKQRFWRQRQRKRKRRRRTFCPVAAPEPQ